MAKLHLDFECFSTLDLTEVGVDNYIRAPDFVVTAIAWAFDNGPVSVSVWPDTVLPLDVRNHIKAGGTVCAWNAMFEWNILDKHYSVNVERKQMDCTMQRSLAFGLPAGLAEAGDALRISNGKDKTARKLMLKMGKPRKDGLYWHMQDTPEAKQMLLDLGIYCSGDVKAEREMDGLLPPLHPFEKRLSLLDAAINEHGVGIDRAAVQKLQKAAIIARLDIDSECTTLTGSMVTSPGTQTAKLLAWLQTQGVFMVDVKKETIKTVLGDPLAKVEGAPRRVLELRQLAAKGSLAKLGRMLAWTSHGGRARNNLQFYGAGRTGRWAGRGIQVQNLPRPMGIKAQDVIDKAAGLDLFYPRPMEAISRALRGCIIARSGHVLVSIDLSQIEARVLAWLAGQDDITDAFRRGEDVYVMQAAKVGSNDRQLGKVLTLACGYGMGARKFMETAQDQYGLTLSLSEATRALKDWRGSNNRIVAFWSDLEDAFRGSIAMPGKIIRFGRVAIMTRISGGWRITQIAKPNGVKLTYHNMRMVHNEGLVFDGVNGVTKKWGMERTYGGRLVENLVQSVARDVMAEAMLRAPRRPVMTVHDDIVWEVPVYEQWAAASDLRTAVDAAATWTTGLPIASEIKISWRYGS